MSEMNQPATPVTSSDGDREGLSDERRELLLTLALADGQDWRGWVNTSEHTAEMMYGRQADAVESILAARLAEATAERDEWKRRSAVDEQQSSDALAAWEQEKARAEVLAERLKSCPRHPHWSGIVTDCAFCDRLAEQVAAVEAKAEQFECGGSTAYSNAAIEIRATLADPGSVIAARDAKVAAQARHVVHVTAEPVAEDAVWCDECEEWVTSGAPDRAAGGEVEQP